MNADLKKRAKKAGIGVRTKPCRLCDGEGSVDVVDGLDLQRIRGKVGVSGYRVAAMAGKQPSHVKMVEEIDPDKAQRRCSDEMLLVYIELAENGAPEETKKRTELQERAYREGGERLRKQNLLRPLVPKVKKGQVWERKKLAEGEETPKRVEVIYVDGSTALVRRFDEPESIGKTIRTETLVQKWRDVTQEVKG
jgi:hypothetical protein